MVFFVGVYSIGSALRLTPALSRPSKILCVLSEAISEKTSSAVFLDMPFIAPYPVFGATSSIASLSPFLYRIANSMRLLADLKWLAMSFARDAPTCWIASPCRIFASPCPFADWSAFSSFVACFRSLFLVPMNGSCSSLFCVSWNSWSGVDIFRISTS